MVHVGKTARQLRESLCLTQVEMAERLGISSIYVSKIENEHAFPTRQIIERYKDKFGVDLYILAWCQYGEIEKLPSTIREPALALAKAWDARLKNQIDTHRKKGE